MGIQFGTSGWRTFIADGFTFANVRVVAQSIVDYLRESRLHNRPVVVGYDTRFLSEDFARTVAGVLAANGIEALLCARDTPTPVVAFQVLAQKAGGGITITASHNPPAYSGIKFNSAWGGPALPETTEKIEAGCLTYLSGEAAPKTSRDAVGIKKRLIVPFDPRPAYFTHLESMVNVPLLKKSRFRVVTDALWGAGRGYLDEFFRRIGVPVTALHTDRDVLFGGKAPTPEPETLGPLLAAMKKAKAALGLATDGDADRFGLMDADGSLAPPNEFLPLLLDHLVKTRGWKGGLVVRSVMTSHFLDAVAKRHGLSVEETPVGFKFIGEAMAREEAVYPSTTGEFLLGGEESGGVTLRGHVPEKDGILACLLAAEIVASTGKSLRQAVTALQKEVGYFFSGRVNMRVTAEQMVALREKLATRPPTRFSQFSVRRIVETDGHKFIMTDGSWVGVRLSGTEPVVRVYVESARKEKLIALENVGREIIASAAAGKK
jgi:alpha-D-glucose phosphate-specific phosphoglucomutase